MISYICMHTSIHTSIHTWYLTYIIYIYIHYIMIFCWFIHLHMENIFIPYAPWCWNMNPNICPCPKSPSFVGKYTPWVAYGNATSLPFFSSGLGGFPGGFPQEIHVFSSRSRSQAPLKAQIRWVLRRRRGTWDVGRVLFWWYFLVVCFKEITPENDEHEVCGILSQYRLICS